MNHLIAIIETSVSIFFHKIEIELMQCEKGGGGEGRLDGDTLCNASIEMSIIYETLMHLASENHFQPAVTHLNFSFGRVCITISSITLYSTHSFVDIKFVTFRSKNNISPFSSSFCFNKFVLSSRKSCSNI